MRNTLFLIVLLVGPQLVKSSEPEVVFEDPLKGQLRDGWRWPAVITFLAGTLATVLFYNAQGFFVGRGAWLFGTLPADISSFTGVIVSLLVFVVLTRLTRRPAVRAPR